MKKIIITFLSGYAAVLLLGMLFYRLDIFNIYSPNFQFTEAGFIGAFLYPVYLFREKKEIFLITFLIIILHFILFKPYSTSVFTRDIVYLAAIIASIGIYVYVILPVITKRFEKVKIFALALIYCFINLLSFFLLFILLYVFFDYFAENFTGTMLLYIRYGFMIGLGLSIGFNFAEFIIKHYANE